ncbi:hypothetical protein [Rhodovulum adriaticum]|uniref:Uncharacterized protein n=1 Tax=Rhodovulum adriaticum TaxID=35804 RepID=A0A4R2NZG9_RHOAD|nr:hypothetical protein [Rhodovulum adriaticum]TCP27577.1 hypothetical protein EV656_101486 [Rhodovulum adriaticum]
MAALDDLLQSYRDAAVEVDLDASMEGDVDIYRGVGGTQENP